MKVGFLVTLSAAATLTMCATHSAAKASLRITPLVLPAVAASAQPSVVADARRNEFVLSWQRRHDDGCHSLQLARIGANENTLGKASTAARGCDWFVNWADFPSVAIADNGDWVTHYLQKTGDAPYAYRIMVTRSRDRGLRWEKAFQLHDDNSPTEHGFVALSAVGEDRVLAAWLDGRQMHSQSEKHDGHVLGASAEHAHHHGDQMSLRSAVIHRDGRLSQALEVDSNVCSCCNNDIARTAGGHQLVFRDRLAEETRDIGTAFWRSQRWQAQSVVHNDGWKIAGCPVNGPAIAAPAAKGKNLVVWTTMVNDQLAVRAKLSSASASASGAMVSLDSGEKVLGRVDAAAWGEDRWLVSWLGAVAASGQSALIVAVLDSRLSTLERHTVATLPAGRTTGMPRLASVKGDTALLVWTDAAAAGEGTEVRAVRITGD